MDTGRKVVLALLFAGLGLIVAFQATGITDPLIDGHAWRQTDTAAMARNFYRHGFRLLYPQIDWGGSGPGYVESEFPLVPFLAAVAYRLFGTHDFVGRIIGVLFSLGTGVMVFLLAKHYFGCRAASLAVWGLAASPLFLFFGRAFMPEAAMLFFSVALIYAFSVWMERGGWGWFAAAAVAGSLAFLLKIPSLYLLWPVAALSFVKWRWKTLIRKELWLLGTVMILPAVLWYLHAAQLRHQTGLTFGIWDFGQDKWGNLAIWSDPAFYALLWTRLHQEVITATGLFFAAIGLLLPGRDLRQREGHVLLLCWAGSIALYVLVVANGNKIHQYYQLPLAPVFAIGVGRALDWVGRSWKAMDLRIENRRVGQLLGWLSVVLLVGIMVWPSWQFANDNYRRLPMAVNALLYEAGRSIQEITQPDDLLLVAYDEGRMPELLYYADRRGWRFDLIACNAKEIEAKASLGAKYLAIATVGTESEAFVTQSACVRLLEPRLQKAASGKHWILYKLE